MLIRFAFSNFMSYKNDTELLLTSSSKIRTNKNHVFPINNKLNGLKFAAIYGDNASGKTNLIYAAEFFKMYTTYGVRPNSKYLAFKGNEDKPTTMNAIFSIDDNIFEYGFSLIREKEPIFKTKILHEYIHIIGNKTNRSNWIYDSEKGLNLKLNKDGTKEHNILFDYVLNGLKEFNANRDEMLFLTYINQPDKRIKDSSLQNLLTKIYNYISHNMVVIGPQTYNLMFIEEIQLNLIKQYTLRFDHGLENITLEKITNEDVEKLLPSDFYQHILESFKKGNMKNAMVNYGPNNFLFASKADNDEVCFSHLMFKHKYLDQKFDFSEESEGTRRFVTLMSYFSQNQNNTTFFIDEVERSMHPVSAQYLFKFCEKETIEKNSQFIFSTHYSDFMKNMLRRDEIYFVDKDVYAQSIIYPLTDFATRTDSNIIKAFLEGEFRKVSQNRKF